jgi:hypothetical protein
MYRSIALLMLTALPWIPAAAEGEGGSSAPSTPALKSSPTPPATAPVPRATLPPGPPQHIRWLDEVRAQREAAEARRKAAQEAADARYRAFDPWGAAEFEALETEAEAHRDALRAIVERRRRATEAEMRAHREAMDRIFESPDPPPLLYSPYGWGGPWELPHH